MNAVESVTENKSKKKEKEKNKQKNGTRGNKTVSWTSWKWNIIVFKLSLLYLLT